MRYRTVEQIRAAMREINYYVSEDQACGEEFDMLGFGIAPCERPKSHDNGHSTCAFDDELWPE